MAKMRGRRKWPIFREIAQNLLMIINKFYCSAFSKSENRYKMAENGQNSWFCKAFALIQGGIWRPGARSDILPDQNSWFCKAFALIQGVFRGYPLAQHRSAGPVNGKKVIHFFAPFFETSILSNFKENHRIFQKMF